MAIARFLLDDHMIEMADSVEIAEVVDQMSALGDGLKVLRMA